MIPHDIKVPNLEQWLAHQGSIRLSSEPQGGFLAVLDPVGTHCRAANLVQLFEVVEVCLKEQLSANHALQQYLITQDIPELRDDATIRVAGCSPLPNPYYRHRSEA